MRLNVSTTPNGGWQYYQPETGWSLTNPLNHSFSSAVNAIAKHRLANPVLASRAGAEQAAKDLEAFTMARLGIKATTPPAARPAPKIQRCGVCGR